MKPINPYTILGWVAIFAVPIAPVFFFAFSVHQDVMARAPYGILAGGVGLVSAVGLEIVGVLAGHLAMEFWRTGKMQRAYLSGGIMALYVVIGVVELWGTIGAVMFLIAPLVYVLVALQQVAEHEEREHARNEKRSLVIDYRQQEAEAARQHELELERLRLANEVKLAKVQAQASTELAQSKAEPAQSQHECGECGKKFGSVQGLNAHQRFCTGRATVEPAYTNGVQKAVLS